MQFITVTPAYGRDYRNRKEAVKDWKDGKDFILQDITSPWFGKPCSVRDFEGKKGTVVNIRYKKLTQVAVVKIK